MRETLIAEHRGGNPPATWKSVQFDLMVGEVCTSFELVIRHRAPGEWHLVQRTRQVPIEDEYPTASLDGDTVEIWPRRVS